MNGKNHRVVPLLTLSLLSLVFLFSIWELARHGMDRDYPFLFLGSLVSGIVVFYFSLRLGRVMAGPGQVSSAGWVGMIPVLFGLYLLSYRGLWRFSELGDGFSWVIVFKALCFFGVGGGIMLGSRWMDHRISEPGDSGESRAS